MSSVIETRSIVSQRTGEPLVEITWGKESGQLDYATAILLANRIHEAAEASLSDAFLIHFCKDQLEIDNDDAAKMLLLFRDYRDKITKGEPCGPIEGS